MTLKEAAKGIVHARGNTYRIGFNDNDETEFFAHDLKELDSLYRDFCKENNLKQNTVDYVEPAQVFKNRR